MWPILLDMTKEESMQHLRCLEIDAFSNLVSALRAQGTLDSDKLKILKETGSILHISQDRHKAEIRRVVNDERLNTIAYQLLDCIVLNCSVNGEKHCADEWAEEGQRLIPLMARVAPQTAYSAIADEVADSASKINKQLPNPASTERKRPPSISPTHSNASTSEQCNKSIQFRMSEPELKKRKLSINLENSSLAQHLMGPPKISKIQQIYRQKTKARQKEQQLLKLKQHELDKSEVFHVQQISVSKPLQVIGQPQKVQPKLAVNQITTVTSSQGSPRINILQNISIHATQNACDEQIMENINELINESAPPQPGCSSDNQPTKIINKVLNNASINKVNQLTIKTTSVPSDMQKTIKVTPRKALPTKTVTTSSGQKLIVVSNPQTLTTSSILQRTLTTIPFKNISVKNFDKFKIVPTTSSSPQQALTAPIQIHNSKQKVVTVRTAANKKMIPFSQVQVLNTKGGFKVLPLGGKIISKTNANAGSVYFMNTTSGEMTNTKSTTSTPVLMSSKPQDINSTSESENHTSPETSTNVPSLDSENLILEDKAEITDIIDNPSESCSPEIIEIIDDVLEENDSKADPKDDVKTEQIIAAETVATTEVLTEEFVEKVEAETNSFYIIDGDNTSDEILIDGVQVEQPLEVLNVVGSLDPITGKYSENEQENASVVESHILEVEAVEPESNAVN